MRTEINGTMSCNMPFMLTIINVDNCLIKWQLLKENFLHTQSICPMFMQIAVCDVKKNDVRVSLTSNILFRIQLFFDAYDKIVFDFRCCMARLLNTGKQNSESV